MSRGNALGRKRREIRDFFGDLLADQAAWRDHEDAMWPKDESASGHDSRLPGVSGHCDNGGIGSLRKVSRDGVNRAELSTSEASSAGRVQWIPEEVVVVLKGRHLDSCHVSCRSRRPQKEGSTNRGRSGAAVGSGRTGRRRGGGTGATSEDSSVRTRGRGRCNGRLARDAIGHGVARQRQSESLRDAGAGMTIPPEVSMACRL